MFKLFVFIFVTINSFYTPQYHSYKPYNYYNHKKTYRQPDHHQKHKPIYYHPINRHYKRFLSLIKKKNKKKRKYFSPSWLWIKNHWDLNKNRLRKFKKKFLGLSHRRKSKKYGNGRKNNIKKRGNFRFEKKIFLGSNLE